MGRRQSAGPPVGAVGSRPAACGTIWTRCVSLPRRDMDSNSNSPWARFTGPNEAYLLDLYDRYRADPSSVEPEIRALFERWGAPAPAGPTCVDLSGTPIPGLDCDAVSAVRTLATAIRMYGHHAAQLDPLGSPPVGDAELLPETHGIQEERLAVVPATIVGGVAAEGAGNALEAIRVLRRVYQGSSGFEFEHISHAEEREWLWGAVESGRYRPPTDPVDGRRLLERLTRVEAFELFLQSAFPAQTRFSLEGLDMLVPMLDELIQVAAEVGTGSVMLAMAHRGRLNVLAHVLEKPYEQIIAEFQGAYQRPNISASGSSDVGWTGDVKYHLGGDRTYDGSPRSTMRVFMAPNPSHLEFINPVVEGMTRAASELRDRMGPPRLDETTSLAVLIHGDASFPAQGVVAETLNLSRLPGYRTGGTIHIITNNQLGFTTPPELNRSTLFASDLAKGFEIPVVHVNADDPEACVAAIRLAHAHMHRFRKDVLIDLIGYRRWGHNEGDEPSFTQPGMYALIAGHPTVREIWAREMLDRGLVSEEEVAGMLRDATERLAAVRRSLGRDGRSQVEVDGDPAGIEAGCCDRMTGHPGPAPEIDTRLPASDLSRLNDEMLTLPGGFHLHPKLEPLYFRRRRVFSIEGSGGSERGIDWGHAEALALASILAQGTPIRMTGEDTSRGTFSQRHLLLRDAATGDGYVPLQHIPSARASFDLWDSPLTEQATLGFEFGYDLQAPETLVIWEAQYGDFANGAQVTIDALITSARSKWGQTSSLIMLLPHGYEGQGPDHSSARVERFLQLAAEDNLRIANCTTAAQYFHLLRRQARLLSEDPRPLVLLSPKSLLRHSLAASTPGDLAQGRFQPVIDDRKARQEPEAVRRLILCSGKVWVDLEGHRSAPGFDPESARVAVVRIEELYPFPATEISRVVEGYPALREVLWVQEEPRNMGAWSFAAMRLRDLLGGRLPLLYAGRTRRASPAEGLHGWHVREQKRLVESAFSPLPASSLQRSTVGSGS